MRLLEEVNTTKGNAGGCGEAGQALSPEPFLSLGNNRNKYGRNRINKITRRGTILST